MKTAAVLCMCWRSTVLPRWKKSQLPTPWARSPNIYEKCSLLFSPISHAVFAIHPKTINYKAESGSIFGREKLRPHTFFNVVDKSSQNLLRAWTHIWRLLKEACWSLVPVVVVVVVFFTLNRSFYPTTSSVPAVSFLILHPREIQIMGSQTVRKRKTKR